MRILLVTSSLPWPTHGGGNQRTNLLYRALQARGDVHTVMISRYGKVPAEKWGPVATDFGGQLLFEERLAEHRLPWRLARKVSPSLPHRLTHTLGGWGCDFKPDAYVARQVRGLVEREGYDLVVGRYMWALARSGAMGLRPTLLDVDDFETDVIEANLEAQQPTGLRRRWIERRFGQVSRVEQGVLERCDHVWVAKAGDTGRVGHDRCSILPNIPFIKDGQAAPEPCLPDDASKTILMVGTLEHPVNVRAIEAFISGPWEQIRAAVQEARFQIIGSGMTKDMRDRWSQVPGVEPIGFADDLRQAYTDAAITVVPIREGGGTKIKVLESLLYGRACVCASHSLRGYEHVLTHGESIIEAKDDQGLVEGCVALLRDPARRRAISLAGGRVVREHYSYERFARTVHQAVDVVMRGTPEARPAIPSNDFVPSVR